MFSLPMILCYILLSLRLTCGSRDFCLPHECPSNKICDNHDYSDIILNEPLSGYLDINSTLVFKYTVKENVAKRIRVHVTIDDIKDVKERTKAMRGCSTDITQCSCSIVSIQRLDDSYNANEKDVVHGSVWQTMIGRSVIDVVVGPETKRFRNGFYIVIVKKKDNAFCRLMDYERSLDGDIDYDGGNTKTRDEGKIPGKHKIPFHIELIEIDELALRDTCITLGMYCTVFLTILVLSKSLGVKITGKVILPDVDRKYLLPLGSFESSENTIPSTEVENKDTEIPQQDITLTQAQKNFQKTNTHFAETASLLGGLRMDTS